MLAYKQLTKQMLLNRVFIILLLVLTTLTSLSFFFVNYTIDGNEGRVAEIAAAGGDGVRYQTALDSNRVLAYTGFSFLTILTAFVFLLFFYRFFRGNSRQMGCLKAIGFKDATLRRFFVSFTAMLSLAGTLLGLGLAYPLSLVLIHANEDTYGVKGLNRSLNADSILFELLISAAVFSLVAWQSYRFVGGKEPGSLIWGNRQPARYTRMQKTAAAVVKKLPIKNKFSLRIALRRPLALCLLLAAVMTFSTCMILAYSLNISSGNVFSSQTEGHNYEYITRYERVIDEAAVIGSAYGMLSLPGIIEAENREIHQTVCGMYQADSLYELQEEDGTPIEVPKKGKAVIGPGLQEVYGIQTGDELNLKISGSEQKFIVENIAWNAQSASIYINGSEMAEMSKNAPGRVNMLFSEEMPKEPGSTLSREERVNLLKRDAVSNQVSGVINQAVGALVGCILMFLALFVNFQDNTRDILILNLIGYRIKAISRMLIDIYRRMVFIFFLVTLLPGIFIVKSIQRNLSVTTGDYMPFGTNIWIILLTAAVLALIYQFVLSFFRIAVRSVIRREEIAEYTGGE